MVFPVSDEQSARRATWPRHGHPDRAVEHQHEGGDVPHVHTSVTSVPVDVAQEVIDDLLERAGRAHLPRCSAKGSVESSGHSPAGSISLEQGADGSWQVSCRYFDRTSAVGPSVVEALEAFARLGGR